MIIKFTGCIFLACGDRGSSDSKVHRSYISDMRYCQVTFLNMTHHNMETLNISSRWHGERTGGFTSQMITVRHSGVLFC